MLLIDREDMQSLCQTSYNLLTYCGALTLQWMKDIGLLKEDSDISDNVPAL